MRQQVVAKLTEHQALRCKRLVERLGGEKLPVEEISRRLLLERRHFAPAKRSPLFRQR